MHAHIIRSVDRVAPLQHPRGKAAVREPHDAARGDGLVARDGRTAGLLKGHHATDGDRPALAVQAEPAVGRLVAVPVLGVGTRGGELRVRHGAC